MHRALGMEHGARRIVQIQISKPQYQINSKILMTKAFIPFHLKFLILTFDIYLSFELWHLALLN